MYKKGRKRLHVAAVSRYVRVIRVARIVDMAYCLGKIGKSSTL